MGLPAGQMPQGKTAHVAGAGLTFQLEAQHWGPSVGSHLSNPLCFFSFWERGDFTSLWRVRSHLS